MLKEAATGLTETMQMPAVASGHLHRPIDTDLLSATQTSEGNTVMPGEILNVSQEHSAADTGKMTTIKSVQSKGQHMLMVAGMHLVPGVMMTDPERMTGKLCMPGQTEVSALKETL